MDELTWTTLLAAEKQAPYFRDILAFLNQEYQRGKTIYPPKPLIFQALALTPFAAVKVVILGQDPYHGPGQAQGLCFSVPKGIAPPPSLQNIFKELRADLGVATPAHGCLESWARQGVLLLNTTLTVEAGKAFSHADIGWQQFTDKIITLLDTHRQGLVFLLWGSAAQKKAQLIDTSRHWILKATHPSPLSAHRGFLGCKHFSTCNQLLIQQALSPIDWNLDASLVSQSSSDLAL